MRRVVFFVKHARGLVPIDELFQTAGHVSFEHLDHFCRLILQWILSEQRMHQRVVLLVTEAGGDRVEICAVRRGKHVVDPVGFDVRQELVGLRLNVRAARCRVKMIVELVAMPLEEILENRRRLVLDHLMEQAQKMSGVLRGIGHVREEKGRRRTEASRRVVIRVIVDVAGQGMPMLCVIG